MFHIFFCLVCLCESRVVYGVVLGVVNAFMKHKSHISDVLPTLLAAGECGNKPKNPIDGYNLWPWLTSDGENEKPRREIPMQINPHLTLYERDPRAFDTTWDTRMQGITMLCSNLCYNFV